MLPNRRTYQWFFVLVVMCGCQSLQKPVALRPYPLWDQYVAKYYETEFRNSPMLATAMGAHTADDKLDNMSMPAVKARLTELKTERDQLNDIRFNWQLDFDQTIDSEILLGQLNGEIFEIEELQFWRRNPTTYISGMGDSLDQLMKRNFAPPATRLTQLIGRLEQIPTYLQQMRENMQNPPEEYTELAIRSIEGAHDFVKNSVTLWARQAAGSNKETLAHFATAQKTALKAIATTAHWLKHDLSPKSHGNFALGPEKFARKLYYDDMVSTPLDHLLATGEEQLRHDREAFAKVANQIAPNQEPRAIFAKLALDHPAEKNLLTEAAMMVQDARQFILDKKIVKIPDGPLPSVVETPPFDRDGTFAALDSPGPLEKVATEAFYYITPTEKNWSAQRREEHLRSYARPNLLITSVHEVYPGHYLQFLYFPQVKSQVRKMASSLLNIEGWAHYSEQMMIEEGFHANDAKIRLGQIQEELLRDCRFVVGMRMHVQGMSFEEGVRLFHEQCYLEPTNAREETLRGTYDPTYLYYTLGKIRIYELRDDYKKKKGSTYSLSQFHQDFLSQGGMPLAMIRRVILQ